jgi:hypothetical protein
MKRSFLPFPLPANLDGQPQNKIGTGLLAIRVTGYGIWNLRHRINQILNVLFHRTFIVKTKPV